MKDLHTKTIRAKIEKRRYFTSYINNFFLTKHASNYITQAINLLVTEKEKKVRENWWQNMMYQHGRVGHVIFEQKGPLCGHRVDWKCDCQCKALRQKGFYWKSIFKMLGLENPEYTGIKLPALIWWCAILNAKSNINDMWN